VVLRVSCHKCCWPGAAPSLDGVPTWQRTPAAHLNSCKAPLLQGRVVEEGSPSELLARGGRYAELWARQASLDDVASHDAPQPPGHGAGSDGDDKEQVRVLVGSSL
jgi:hypothetical protein